MNNNDDKRPGAGESIALRLTPNLLERIDTARVVGQRTRSEAVRQWLERGLTMEEKMKSFEQLYRMSADNQGVLRFYFKPGIFQAGAFSDAVNGYKDPNGQWLDARPIQFDEVGVVVGANHFQTYIPWANVQQVTRRPL